MKKFTTLVVSLLLAALAAACGGDANTNLANASRPANSNTAVVTNTTTTNTTANTNRAPTKEDVEKNKESYGKQAKDAGRKIGTGANDTWLWAKARYDLAAASDLRDSTINVDVENGVITLTGTVASQDQLKKADTIAKAVDGQKGVQNKLKVAAATGNANTANTKK
jgi:hyperosmotically inducible periplasmic protein